LSIAIGEFTRFLVVAKKTPQKRHQCAEVRTCVVCGLKPCRCATRPWDMNPMDGFPWGRFRYIYLHENHPKIKHLWWVNIHFVPWIMFFLQGGRPELIVVNGVTGYYKPFKWPDKWVSEVISPSKWPKRLLNGGDPTYLLTSD